MEVDAAAPTQVTTGKTIGPEDFVNDAALPYIVALLEQNLHLGAQKAEEWQKKARLQKALLHAMDSDDDFDF
jgi:hypothetical protein